MPIPLNKHSKIWIHPDGVIPDKIFSRLLYQRLIRPDDQLTLFINESCLTGSNEKLSKLSQAGVKIQVIEKTLSDKKDDPYLVKFILNILEKVKITKDVKDSVFASDYLRLTNLVQNEGLYYDTDVLFLNQNNEPTLSTSYLLGNHNEDKGILDIHILGLDSYMRENKKTRFASSTSETNDKDDLSLDSDSDEEQESSFYGYLVSRLKEFFGKEPPGPTNDKLAAMPGIHFVGFLSGDNHGHLDFEQTKTNVLSGRDKTHQGGDVKLHDNQIQDEFLELAKAKVQQIKTTNQKSQQKL